MAAGTNKARRTPKVAGRSTSRVEVSEAAEQWLGSTGFDPVYGARPLRRLVQSTIEDALARGLLGGEIHDGQTVTFDAKPDGSGIELI